MCCTNNKSKHNFSFGNNLRHDDTPEDNLTNSKDTDFERYKRKKKQQHEHDYQFKKKGRNIFDSDKGEDGEEAFDYYEIKSFNEHYEIMHFDLNKRRRTKKYSRTVNDEQERKMDFSSGFGNSYLSKEFDDDSDWENEDR